MPETRILVLVEDNEADAELVRAYLSENARDRFVVHHVMRMSAAVDKLHELHADVVLLDLRLPDSSATDSVAAIRDAAQDVPILVLTGTDDEDLAHSCIEAGAQDYLLKNELRPNNLRRAIGYALTRQRESELRELRETLERYRALTSEAAPTPITAELAGLGPVKLRLPEEFQTHVDSYSQLLHEHLSHLLAQRSKPRFEMEKLVTLLGDIGAGPKDLIDVHVSALDRSLEGQKSERGRALIVEGRLLALEMMGLLVDYYRVGQRRRFATGDLS